MWIIHQGAFIREIKPKEPKDFIREYTEDVEYEEIIEPNNTCYELDDKMVEKPEEEG